MKWRKAFKLRNPRVIRGAAFGAACVLKGLYGTLGLRVRSDGDIEHPLDPATQPCIYAFWHESMLAPAKVRAAAQILVSQSADGELIALIAQHLGVSAIRGSSSKGGAAALLELTRRGAERKSHLLVTPDGPRGPRRTVQPGIVYLASKCGLPIVPVGVGFTRAWRARSWDRFAVPLPFSTILGVVGAPIAIPDKLSAEGLSFHRRQVEARMLETTAAAERWAEFGRRSSASDVTPREQLISLQLGEARHVA